MIRLIFPVLTLLLTISCYDIEGEAALNIDNKNTQASVSAKKSNVKQVIKVQKKEEKHWLQKEYYGKSTNSIVRDERFIAYKHLIIPDKKSDLGIGNVSLFETFREFIGGPPNDIIFDTLNNSVYLSACRPNSCDEKAFMFIDYKQEVGFACLVHYVKDGLYNSNVSITIASKFYKTYDELPKKAIEKLEYFLIEERVLKEESINPNSWSFIIG